MSIGADAADQMVREGIQITESAVRLAALGAKNLAALLIALAASPKSRGATTGTAAGEKRPTVVACSHSLKIPKKILP